MYDVPNVVAFSRSCLVSAPIGSSFLKKTFGSEVMMWKCLESGSKLRNTRMTRLCSHQATLLAGAAIPGPPIASRIRLIM